MFLLRRVVTLVPLILISACASERSPGQDVAQAAYATGDARASLGYSPWTEEDYHYRLGAGDELALRFMINPDLNGAAAIGPDGRAVVPLVGGVKLAGLTVNQADYALTNAYGQILRNPQVEALVTTYGAAQIYVGGEVKEPGVKAIKGQISITQAVMAGGGFSDTARTGKVVVMRQGAGDPKPHLRVVDVRAQLKGASNSGEFLLQPGDVVFVPRSAIGEVDRFVKQYITDLIPFGFSYGISGNGKF